MPHGVGMAGFQCDAAKWRAGCFGKSAAPVGELPFLRIPPFPGSSARPLAQSLPSQRIDSATGPDLMAALTAARVGGKSWGEQPVLPSDRDIVLAPASSHEARAMFARAKAEELARRVLLIGSRFQRGLPGALQLGDDIDPWHLAGHASAVWTGADNELALVTALSGKPVSIFGQGRFSPLGEVDGSPDILGQLVADELLSGIAYRDPFTGKAMDALAAIGLLAGWRRLIDRNRRTSAVFGVAQWKRATLDGLLWDGRRSPPYARSRGIRVRALGQGDSALVWKSRAPAGLPDRLERGGVATGEIEDGFIRSKGLGANCVPPLSIVVDYMGVHFDPAQPSELEMLIQNADISPDLIERAADLRECLVAAGLDKYGQGRGIWARPAGARRHVLVTGQVEDDRSMLSGGAGCSNWDLIRQARSIEPDAYLIYKPHPDVEAGHRKGDIPDADVLQFADQVERSASIAALLDNVDAVHVITSLAGFEALMRGKQVTTHGVPFFAGWGLTRDLGQVPARRTADRSLDELVAATLILYPRYLDPVTRLPCPVEVLVERMAKEQATVRSPLIWLRQKQGQLKTALKHIRRSA